MRTKNKPDVFRGRWMTLPIYSTKVHFFTPPGPDREAAWPSLCPQFYSSFMSEAVRGPEPTQRCKTCNDRLARLTGMEEATNEQHGQG